MRGAADASDTAGAVLETETRGSGPQDFLKNFQFGSSVYNLGDFFKSSGQNTIGSAYVNSLNNEEFRNPIEMNSLNCDNLSDSQSYFASFNILHAADTLFRTLLNTGAQDLAPAVVETQYKNFDTQFNQLRSHIAVAPNTGAGSSVFSSALFDSCACDCLPCLLLDLIWLLEQIALRIQQFESDMLFKNYFAKHPGLEHKAGVPKGGTFVLVYSDANLAPAQVTGLKSLNDAGLNDRKAPVVIADFYIPYLCCSDCTPVVNINQPPPDDVHFDIAPRYLFEDARQDYQFTISPFPNNIAEIGNPAPHPLNIYIDGGKLYLHPAMEIDNTITNTLTYSGKSLPITIVKPDASFKMTINADASDKSKLIVSLDADHKDADAVYECVITNIKRKKEIYRAGPVPQSTPSFSTNLLKIDYPFTVELTITYTINGMKSTDNKIWKPDPASDGIPTGTLSSTSE